MALLASLKTPLALALERLPATPGQGHGGGHGDGTASTSDTQANGGSGRAPAATPGALGEAQPLSQQARSERTIPQRKGFDATTSRRVATDSTATSDVYANADGSYTRIVSTAPVNFRDADGSWKPIDSRLVRDASGKWRVAANSMQISLAGISAAQRKLGFERGQAELSRVVLAPGKSVGWTLDGASLPDPAISGTSATYSDVLPSTDVVLDTFHSGLKETLVLHSADAPSSWVFKLDLHGLTASLDETGGITLRDAAGAAVARIPAGFMEDANVDAQSGEGKVSRAVSYELTTVDGQSAVRVTADSAWLKDPARVFPVRMDPTTVTVNSTTYVQSITQFDDLSGETQLKTGQSPSVSNLQAWSLFKFPDFSSNYLGYKMTSAKLRLRVYWSGSCSQQATVSVLETTSAWSPNTVRYANPPSLGALVAGGGPTAGVRGPSGSVCWTNDDPNNPNENDWWDFDFNGDGLNVLNRWTGATATNHGLAVQTPLSGAGNWLKMSSVNTNYPPAMEITYTPNQAPVVTAQYPTNGYASPTLTPELRMVASDPDAYPKAMTYQFVMQDPASANPTANIVDSGWIPSQSYTVPQGALSWSKTYVWTVYASDGNAISSTQTMNVLSTSVPQAPITSGLSQNADKGFSTQVGNYTTSAVDAQVPGVGPPLSISRAYNSRDSRTGQAFGLGWSSILDSKASEVTDAGASTPRAVTITYPTGQDVTFGRNNDGSFAPPSGRFSTLRSVAGGYELVDKEGTRYIFTVAKATGVFGLTGIADAAGRTLSLTYTAGKVSQMIGASGRRLNLTWSGSNVATVANEAGDLWGYTYTSGLLTKVCPPTSTTACHQYEYGNNSLYPTAVLDTQPHTYWRLNEPAGALAAQSSAVDNTDTATGTYANVTLGAAGPLPGATGWTAPTAASFNGTSSYVEVSQPKAAMKRSVQSVSMWFKTSAPGVLLGYQQKDLLSGASLAFAPPLYIGTDGKLRGEFWPAGSIVSTGTVTNNAWHHVVLTASGIQEQMWLDGNLVATATGTPDMALADYAYVGAGKWDGWNATTGTHGYFNGSIAEFAWYDRPLSGAQAASMYNAGISVSKPLTKVIRPSGGVNALVEYDAASGIVKKLTDENNGVWTINPPVVSGTSAVHTSAVLAAAPADYFRLVDTNNEVNGVTGTFSGVTFSDSNPGPLGERAAQFTFSPDSNMIGSGPSIDTSKSYSLSAWVYMTAKNWNQEVVTVKGNKYVPFLLGYGMNNDRWRMAVCNQDEDNLSCPDARSSAPAALNTWTHLAASVDAATREVKLYVNGQLEGTVTVPALWKANGPLMIGRTQWGAGNFGDFWPGRLAEVATYQHVLSPEQVRAQFDARQKAANVALNKAATGSAPCGPNEGPEKAVNGSFSAGLYDKWCSLAASRSMQVDLGATRSVTSFVVRHAGAGGENPGYNTRDFTIEVSADGVSWSTAVNVVGNSADTTTHPVTATQARYARLNVLTPTQTTDTAARIYEFEVYSGGGPGVPVKTVTVSDPGAKTTSYVYDLGNGGRQVRQVDFRGGVTSYGFDTGGFLRTTTDPNGNMTMEEHDVRGNVIAKTTCQDRSENKCSTVYMTHFPDNAAKVLTPDPRNDVPLTVRDGRSTSSTDNTFLTTSAYDAQGNLTSVTDPLGRVTRTAYTTPGDYIPHDHTGLNASGRYVRMLGTRRGTTGGYYLREFQVFGPTGGNLALDLNTTASSAVQWMGGAVDGHALIGWYSASTDNEWLYVDLLAVKTISRVRLLWSSFYGRDYQIQVSNDATTWTTIKTVTDASATTIPAGLPLQQITPGGAIHRSYYSAAGDVVMTVDPSGLETLFEYNAVGRLTSKTVKAPTGDQVTTFTYDKANRVLTQTDPAVVNRVTGATHTSVTTMGYDTDGNTVSQTVADSTGGDSTRTATNTYNTLGQLASTTDALNKTRSFTYDLYGNKVTETDPVGAKLEYTYDAPGQLTKTTVKGWTGDPNNPSAATDLVVESRAYDPAGRLASATDAMGWQTLYTYTDNGLTATVTRKNPVSSATFVAESNVYDAAGNVIEKVTNNGTMRETFAVDAASRVTSQTLDPAGLKRTTDYTLNADDDTVATTNKDASGAVISYSEAMYDIAGRDTASAVFPATGLTPVGRWPLAETAGAATAVDSAGNTPLPATNVTWTNDPTRGQVATFDGTTSKLTTDAGLVDTTRDFSVSAWVKLAAKDSQRYIAVMRGSNIYSAFKLSYRQSTDSWYAEMFVNRADGFRTSFGAESAAGLPQANVWTHLTATLDVDTKTLKLYVNGTLAGSGSTTDLFQNRAVDFAIGDQYGTNKWSGAISDVQLYQKELSASEITGVRNGTAPAASAKSIRTSQRFGRDGLVTASRDANGNVSRYEYDAAGQLTVTTSASAAAEENGGAPVTAAAVSTVGYNTFGEVTEQRDAKGKVTTTIRDAVGQATEMRMPSYTPPGSSTPINPVSKMEYDSSGQLTKTIDPLLNETTQVYDQLGRLAKATAPNLGTTKYTYTLNGEPLSVTDPNGARSETTYDFMGRKVTTTQVERAPAASHVTTYAYNAAGMLQSVTPPGRNPTTYEYNAAGELTKVTDGAGNPVRFTYDALGRKAETIEADDAKQTVIFDVASRPTVQRRISPTGVELSATSISYDADGNVLSTTDALGNVTSFTYDATNLVTQMVEPVSATDSITTSFGYDIAGRPTRFTDGRNNKFVTTYNSWGLPESEIEPDGATFTTIYDAGGRAVTRNEPGAVTVTNAYNNMSQLTGQTGAGADATTAARTFGYDTGGRLTSITEGSNTTNFSYNDRGMLTSTTGAAGASSFTYTADGLMATRTDAAGTATYGYDTSGRLSTVADPLTAQTATYAYNNLNQVTSIAYGASSNKRNLAYDGLRRLATDTLVKPDQTAIASIAYGYDTNGNLTSKTTAGFAGAGANTYAYDKADRLTSWNGTAYEYDKSGNRTKIGSRTFTYDARNRLSSDGSTTYSYSARGTLSGTTVGTVTTPSTFDAYGQQISQGSQSYTYDGANRLLATSSGATFTYSGTGNDPASDGTALYSRDPGGDLSAVKQGAGSGLWGWTDQHDDVVGQFTSTGTTLAGSRTYDPFGVVLANAGLAGNLGYQSGWTDPGTSRVNMHSRWYNPATAQFSSRDNVTVSARPQSIRANRYSYGDGNPLTVTDPTGHWGFNPFKAVASAVSKVTSAVSNTWNTVTSTVSSWASSAWNTVSTWASNAYNWAKDKVTQAYNWAKEKVSQVKNWVTSKVTQIKNWAVQKYNQAKEAAKQVYNQAKQAVIEGAKRAAEATKAAAKAVAEAGKKYVEANVQAIKDAYKATANWIEEHKAEIAGFVVGAVVGFGCGALIGWTGVGAVACGALAGAAGSFVTGYMQGKRGWALAGDVAIGAIGGALGGGAGSLLGKGISWAIGAGTKAVGRALGSAVATFGRGAASVLSRAGTGLASAVTRVASGARAFASGAASVGRSVASAARSVAGNAAELAERAGPVASWLGRQAKAFVLDGLKSGAANAAIQAAAVVSTQGRDDPLPANTIGAAFLGNFVGGGIGGRIGAKRPYVGAASGGFIGGSSADSLMQWWNSDGYDPLHAIKLGAAGTAGSVGWTLNKRSFPESPGQLVQGGAALAGLFGIRIAATW